MSKIYSVLMSVYHKEKPDYLIECIESMLSQTVKPEQMVLVKDGPLTTELDKVIDNYQSKYPNLFTVVSLETNHGLGLALNEGLKQCRNNLVARMDTDDISLPERCELQLKEFEVDPELSICGTLIDEFQTTPDNLITTRVVPQENKDLIKFSRRRSPFNHMSVMYKRDDVLSCEGGYHDILRKEDIDLFVRMLNSGFKGLNIQKSLVYARTDENHYRRRKTWINCKSYILVIYNFWKKGYSSTIDLIYVTTSQLVMFLSPIWLLEIISNRILRRKIK